MSACGHDEAVWATRVELRDGRELGPDDSGEPDDVLTEVCAGCFRQYFGRPPKGPSEG